MRVNIPEVRSQNDCRSNYKFHDGEIVAANAEKTFFITCLDGSYCLSFPHKYNYFIYSLPIHTPVSYITCSEGLGYITEK